MTLLGGVEGGTSERGKSEVGETGRLHTLIAAWREAAVWEFENSNEQWAQAIEQCANELEAALREAGQEPK